MAKNGLNVRCLCPASPKPRTGLILSYVAEKPNSAGTWSTRNFQIFVVSKPQIRPRRRLDPRTSGHLVEPGGQRGPRMVGIIGGSTRVPGAKKKNHFFQSFS